MRPGASCRTQATFLADTIGGAILHFSDLQLPRLCCRLACNADSNKCWSPVQNQASSFAYGVCTPDVPGCRHDNQRGGVSKTLPRPSVTTGAGRDDCRTTPSSRSPEAAVRGCVGLGNWWSPPTLPTHRHTHAHTHDVLWVPLTSPLAGVSPRRRGPTNRFQRPKPLTSDSH